MSEGGGWGQWAGSNGLVHLQVSRAELSVWACIVALLHLHGSLGASSQAGP